MKMMEAVWAILLLVNLLLATLRSIFPALRMDGMSAGEAQICYMIALVGFAIYTKIGAQKQ